MRTHPALFLTHPHLLLTLKALSDNPTPCTETQLLIVPMGEGARSLTLLYTPTILREQAARGFPIHSGVAIGREAWPEQAEASEESYSQSMVTLVWP